MRSVTPAVGVHCRLQLQQLGGKEQTLKGGPAIELLLASRLITTANIAVIDMLLSAMQHARWLCGFAGC